MPTKELRKNVVISHKISQCKKIGINGCNFTSIMLRDREYHYKLVLNLGSMVSKKWLYLSLRMEQNYLSHGPSTGPKQNGILCPLKVVIRISSCHICRIPTQGALILNHLQEAKTTEKSWSLTINSKFNSICCFNAAVLHPNKITLSPD